MGIWGELAKTVADAVREGDWRGHLLAWAQVAISEVTEEGVGVSLRCGRRLEAEEAARQAAREVTVG